MLDTGQLLIGYFCLEQQDLVKNSIKKSKQTPVIADSDSGFYIVISIKICFLIVNKHHKTKTYVKKILCYILHIFL